MNAIIPAHLTATERLDELCDILARGVVRLTLRSASPHHEAGRCTPADRPEGLRHG